MFKVPYYFDNKSDIDLIYSNDFVIEEKIDGKWYELPVVIEGEFGFKDIGYVINPGINREFKLKWGWLYGELKQGEYRIIKEVSNLEDTGDYKQYYLSTEFHVYYMLKIEKHLKRCFLLVFNHYP